MAILSRAEIFDPSEVVAVHTMPHKSTLLPDG
jgi:hypothetical protein